MVPSTYEGPKALGFSKYASPAHRKAELAEASAAPTPAPPISDTTIATKQQVIVLEPTYQVTPPAAGLAVEQGTTLKKQIEDHTRKFSRAVSSAVSNTHQLLSLLRESTAGSEVVDNLWQELEQLFEAANHAKAALPEFMEKQRDNMSLYHSSVITETIHEAQEELNLQHKKVSTQHSLILEQQEAFQNYRTKTDSKLKELESLQERVSRLTLEKGNFRTEVDKYKGLLRQKTVVKADDLETANALLKELEMLVSSKKQLQVENGTLRKTIDDTLQQLKNIEQRVTDRFTKELTAKAEELQKESAKTVSLNTLVNDLRSSESDTKKELDKLKNESRLLSVKYNNQASEHAAAFTQMNDQIKKIEALTTEVRHLQKQNVDLQTKLEKAAELAKDNKELSKAKDDMVKQCDSFVSQLDVLKTKLAAKDIALVASSDNALLDKIKELEEKKEYLEGALAEWTELAKRSYREYKDMLPTYKEAEKHRQDAREKELQIADLKRQLAASKTSSQSNVVGAAGGDSAYWKQKYEILLSNL